MFAKVTLFVSAAANNSNYRAAGAVAEGLKLAVFWQRVSVAVVYVALWVVCRKGLSCWNIESAFNLAVKHQMTHGLCVIVRGGRGGGIAIHQSHARK